MMRWWRHYLITCLAALLLGIHGIWVKRQHLNDGTSVLLRSGARTTAPTRIPWHGFVHIRANSQGERPSATITHAIGGEVENDSFVVEVWCDRRPTRWGVWCPWLDTYDHRLKMNIVAGIIDTRIAREVEQAVGLAMRAEARASANALEANMSERLLTRQGVTYAVDAKGALHEAGGILLGCLLVLSLWWVPRYLKEVGQHEAKTGCCPDCGYDVRGLRAGVCPECGHRVPSRGAD